MSDLNWSSYVGMITGIIGAVTGIMGYRKASSLKSLDLRLELQKATHDAFTDVHQIEELIDKANKSRQAVAAARRLSGSGMMKKWKDDVEEDKIQLAKLLENAPNPKENFKKCSQSILESKLIELHKFQTAVNDLKNRYIAELRLDEESRKQIREDHRKSF
ncbi:hypothetical protein GURASL_29690 [Geotalea uraniireducens]|uniref:Uncharacterized protein n=1 Tax=Geotalea uraniireducens TaxID=351604 RepID=A0ABM8EP47_9BACT|nr:hypothetical protein [Geotalea uraniireducens]BDV44046.1 hypothetical protein GURASL_29690 [Geotalea uraniireducens]